MDNFAQQLKDFEGQISVLRIEVETLENRKAELLSSIGEVEDQLEDLKIKYKSQELELVEYQDGIIKDNEKIENEISIKEKELKELSSQIENSQSILDGIDEEITSKRNEIEDKINELRKFELDKRSEVDLLTTQIGALRTEKKNLTDENSEIKSNNKNFIDDLKLREERVELRENTVADNELDISNRLAALIKKENELKETDSKILHDKQSVEEQQKINLALADSLQEKENRLNDKETSLNIREDMLRKKSDGLEMRDIEITRKEEDVDNKLKLLKKK